MHSAATVLTKVTLVHNPSAGTAAPGREELTKLFEESGYSVRYCDIRGELESTLAEPADVVVVAGGDGTVGEVLQRVEDTCVPVALLPLGSANNIATALGHMRPLVEVVSSLKHAVPRRFDIGVADGPWGRRRFVEGVGFGPLASALAVCDATGIPGHRSVHFGRATLRTLLDEVEPMPCRIQLDDQSLADDFAMIEVLNIAQIGPRLRLAPSADPGDGLLDVLCVPYARRDEMLAWLEDPDSAPSPFAARQVNVVGIACDRPVAIHIDDEFPETFEQGPFAVQIAIEDAAVIVLRPPDEWRVPV